MSGPNFWNVAKTLGLILIYLPLPGQFTGSVEKKRRVLCDLCG